jgi:predicted dehydrogenase
MKKVRIGLIGASGRAIIAQNWHAPISTESDVVAAADVSDAALEACRAWAGPALRTTRDYRDITQDPSIDAIAVMSPDRFHEEHALAVLNAGKHLYLEKPMALTTEGCDRILAAWKNSGAKFMIGFNLRYNPVAVKAREIIRSGRLGNIKAIWVRHFVGAGGDFYFHDWHATREGVHSLLLQKASHDLDLIHWLADSYAERVAAFGDRDYFGGDQPDELTCDQCAIRSDCREEQAVDNPRQMCAFRREVDVEDNQVVILKLANGTKASYTQCHFTPEYLRSYTVIGTEGRLEFELEKDRLWVVPRQNKTKNWPEAAVTEQIDLKDGSSGEGHGGADPLITKGFLDMILRGVEPVSTPLAGRMSVAAGCAAVASLRQGVMTRITPAPR